MIIRNNTVHDHGAMGIICSLVCYNLVSDCNSGIRFSMMPLRIIYTTIQLQIPSQV
jgi:hypothetical protein